MMEIPLFQSHAPSRPRTRNYSNPHIHAALSSANLYKARGDCHVLAARADGKRTATIERNLSKEGAKNVLNRKVRSVSALDYKGRPGLIRRNLQNRRPENGQIKLISSHIEFQDAQVFGPGNEDRDGLTLSAVKNPETTARTQNYYTTVRDPLVYRTEVVPEFSTELQTLLASNAVFVAEIKKLKTQIFAERKKKSKISLDCNKAMNECELVSKSNSVLQEQNSRLQILIQQVLRECEEMQAQNVDTGQKVNKIKQSLQQEQKLKAEAKKKLEETRMQLLAREKQAARLRAQASQAHNNMENCFMKMGLLQAEKALLMADVAKSYTKVLA